MWGEDSYIVENPSLAILDLTVTHESQNLYRLESQKNTCRRLYLKIWNQIPGQVILVGKAMVFL